MIEYNLNMLQKLKKLLGHTYKPLNDVELNQFSLRDNFQYLSCINNYIKVAPVLKSNAYGHGINLIAKQLDILNPPFFCVDSLYEGYKLLKLGIRTKILIMGYINPESLKTKKLPFSFAIYNYELLNAINKYQPHANIHIFIDTGMHREGLDIEELPEFLKYIKINTKLNVEGLMSHFAMADKPKDKLTQRQIKIFQKSQLIIQGLGMKPRWIHIANSSGLLNSKTLNGSLGNVARVGIALYGIDPEGKNNKLKPVLKLKSHITQIKELRKGEKIGYDFAYRAQKNMKIAILPIGYYDGVDRRLSNKGFVSINNVATSIVGKVSMNLTIIDVSNIPNVKNGQEVILYSDISSAKNSVGSAAKLCGTIPYDLLVHITSSTKRLLM